MKMSYKTSIHLSPALSRLRDVAKENPHQGFGGMLTTIVERYNEIVRRHKPDLEEAEWNLIRDSMSSSAYWDRPESVSALPISIRDAIDLDGLDKKWEIDRDSLLKKMNEMDYAALASVVESVEDWWRKQE